MQLLLKPTGRGNWSPLVLTIPKQRCELPRPLDWRAGQRLTIDGRVYRVAKVMP